MCTASGPTSFYSLASARVVGSVLSSLTADFGCLNAQQKFSLAGSNGAGPSRVLRGLPPPHIEAMFRVSETDPSRSSTNRDPSSSRRPHPGFVRR